ncbi:MAG: hypothetical protein ACOCV1_00050 [Bacillota bacterium]
MVTPIVKSAGKYASRGTFGILKVVFKLSIVFIIVLLTFLGSILKASQEDSFQEGVNVFIYDIGNKMLLTTQELGDNSRLVIENEGFGDGVKTNIINFSAYISPIFIIYAWIKLFAFLFARSWFSNESEWFKNHSLGAFTFIFFQLVIMAGFGNGTFFENISQPFSCFYYFFKSIPYAIKPFYNKLNG